MKIIDIRSGKLQEIPFALGEKGRGRWFEEVKVSNRPGQEPEGPHDVGYFVFGQERKHVILTKSNPNQRGVLLRINTEGTYTRGTSGEVILKGGKATKLVAGEYAYGEAGGIGGGTDELWHAEGPSIFVVKLSGGAGKGYGHRYLVVTEKFETFLIKRDELCQIIASDENPGISEVARMFANELHEDVQAAIKLADELEAFEQPNNSGTLVQHFVSGNWNIEGLLETFGIKIPAAMGKTLGGVNGVLAGTIVPGTKSLVVLNIGPGGGKRYGWKEVSELGLTRLQSKEGRGSETILALVEDPNWHSAWINYKDGEVTDYILVDALGIHTYDPNYEWGEYVRIDSWSGMTAKSKSVAEMKKFFNL